MKPRLIRKKEIIKDNDRMLRELQQLFTKLDSALSISWFQLMTHGDLIWIIQFAHHTICASVKTCKAKRRLDIVGVSFRRMVISFFFSSVRRVDQPQLNQNDVHPQR